MMYIDVKVMKKATYREFVEQHLKNNNYIIVSMLDNDVPISFGKTIPLPENIDFHSLHISGNEQLYCYENKYYVSYSTLIQYKSFNEFFDYTNIYRLILATGSKVTVQCMYDEIIVY